VTDFSTEKELATQLRDLRRQVKKLRDEIRGGALPVRNSDAGPALPTEPERRSRPVTSDDEKKIR
jgi:hypothetical protein